MLTLIELERLYRQRAAVHGGNALSPDQQRIQRLKYDLIAMAIARGEPWETLVAICTAPRESFTSLPVASEYEAIPDSLARGA